MGNPLSCISLEQCCVGIVGAISTATICGLLTSNFYALSASFPWVASEQDEFECWEIEQWYWSLLRFGYIIYFLQALTSVVVCFTGLHYTIAILNSCVQCCVGFPSFLHLAMLGYFVLNPTATECMQPDQPLSQLGI